MTKSNNKTTYTAAIGRRKSAVSSVKLFAGKAESLINGLEISKYFPGEHNKKLYFKPFAVTDTDNKYYFHAKIVGGGKNGQLDALVLSIARCLKKIDATNFLPKLRTAGLLTVDSRVRERRMVGTGGKARRQKQSPKR
jgi:small subunit ribosomal protein S9